MNGMLDAAATESGLLDIYLSGVCAGASLVANVFRAGEVTIPDTREDCDAFGHWVSRQIGDDPIARQEVLQRVVFGSLARYLPDELRPPTACGHCLHAAHPGERCPSLDGVPDGESCPCRDRGE